MNKPIKDYKLVDVAPKDKDNVNEILKKEQEQGWAVENFTYSGGYYAFLLTKEQPRQKSDPSKEPFVDMMVR